jgi:response regulator RpfG family c-di-GMP phosphodiesterase
MSKITRVLLDGTVAVTGGSDPVPTEVTNFQARAALRRAGHLDRVHAALQAAPGEAWDAWEYANHLYRNGALVQAFAAQLGFTEAQIDDLFRVAAGIEA